MKIGGTNSCSLFQVSLIISLLTSLLISFLIILFSSSENLEDLALYRILETSTKSILSTEIIGKSFWSLANFLTVLNVSQVDYICNY